MCKGKYFSDQITSLKMILKDCYPQEKIYIEIMQNIIILGLFHIVLHILRLPISGDILDSEEYKNCILNDSKSNKSKQAFMLERLTPISAKK